MTDSLAYQSFAIRKGEAFSLPITVVDNNGAAVNLTGATVRFIMARRTTDTVLAVDSNASPTQADCELTQANPGIVTASMSDEQTAALSGSYYYAVQVRDSSGNESLIAHGIASVLASPI